MKCKHPKLSGNEGYVKCPDCGKLVHIQRVTPTGEGEDKSCSTCVRKPDYRTFTCKDCSPNYSNHQENDEKR